MIPTDVCEVLSPAGSPEMLTAAVRSGADAVYFGAKHFSARRNAENFDIDEIRQAVRYCRIRGVKTYLTLNIMLKDDELKDAVQLAADAADAGIDGIIIQDLGLARLLHTMIPGLPLHASTQMSVHSVSALSLLKKMGFCQVVAAREMSFDELRVFCAAAAKLGITVESFVHGALCMCVSGQCLLSSFLGSRSGNRGLCAGPCRLPFAAENGTGYDLSLKDLSLLDYINELRKIGVQSFKIEGRMKRPEYVAAATAACRQAVDSGMVDGELLNTLKDVFSRSGFTSVYYEGRLGRDMFGIRTREDVMSADTAFPSLHELYRGERQSVCVSGSAVIAAGEKISLTLSDGKYTVTAYGEIPQTAEKKAAEAAEIRTSLSKLGSTPYLLEKLDIVLDSGLFVRGSALNALRRDACALLDDMRAAVEPVDKNEFMSTIIDIEHHKNPDILIRIEELCQLPENLSGINGVIVALEADISSGLPDGVRLIADIPRGIVSENAVRERLGVFRSKGFTAAMCGNLAAVGLAQEAGFEIIADTGMNVYNSQSAAAVQELGASASVLSSEILLKDAKRLKSRIPKGIIAYGSIPLMLFRNCPVRNGKSCRECDRNGTVTDRKGVNFRVRCRMGYSEMLNSVPIWLADRLDELSELDFTVLYFTSEPRERVERVIAAYKNGSAPDIEYTRGLYYRGTI